MRPPHALVQISLHLVRGLTADLHLESLKREGAF